MKSVSDGHGSQRWPKIGKMVSKIGLKIGNWCWNSSKKISKWN